jgi:type II secretory pathway pseudopilin PulG
MNRSSESGHTLLEALIATAIVASIAAVLAPALYASVRAAARQSEVRQAGDEIRAARSALDEIFAAILTTDARVEDGRFFAKENEVEATILLSLAGAPQRIRLRIDHGELSLVPLDHGGAIEAASIMSGAKRFRFYGRTDPQSGQAWRSSWDAPTPPELVGLELSEESKFKMLTFPVRNRAPLVCEFDQVTRRCRN